MPTDYAIKNGRTVMDATTYTGDGTSPRAITNSESFKPDFVWIKNRGQAYFHNLYDSVRGTGATKNLISNGTYTEGDSNYAALYGYLSGFNSNGFQVTTGNDASLPYIWANKSGDSYVAWQWQAGQGTTSSNTAGSITSTTSVNATAGFSIVTWTGTGANSNVTIGHGLGVTPAMVIVKPRSAVVNWAVAHQSLGNARLYLDLTSASASGFGGGGDLNYQNTFTSTTFNVQPGSLSNNNYNGSGETLVAYCWAEVAGFSKFGSYTGNGSADGVFVYTGFRPKFVMFKRTDTSGDWNIRDTSRSQSNVVGEALYPNLSFAEYSGTETYVDLLSNGFKFRGNWASSNASGGTYVYACFAENPLKYANAR